MSERSLLGRSAVSMPPKRRLRIAFVLASTNYRAGATYVLSSLPLLSLLALDHDVTLIVRSLLEEPLPGLRVLPILPRPDGEDIYHLGKGWLGQLSYLLQVRRFARRHAADYDLVFEKAWPYVGLVCQSFRRAGTKAVPVLEGEFYQQGEAGSSGLAGLRHRLKQGMMSSLRRGLLEEGTQIVVETRQLAKVLAPYRSGGSKGGMTVIPVGVDPKIYRPHERRRARAELGLDQERPLMTYVGSLNGSIQHPDRIIEGLALARRDGAEIPDLEIVGSGLEAPALRGRVAQLGLDENVRFHGFLPPRQAVAYIHAADLCLAPYRQELYADRLFTSASCKLVEYLACGRLVLTIPAERMRDLTDDGRFGYLVDNDSDAYARFFAAWPSRSELADKERDLAAAAGSGELMRREIVLPWTEIAQSYRCVIAKATDEPSAADIRTAALQG